VKLPLKSISCQCCSVTATTKTGLTIGALSASAISSLFKAPPLDVESAGENLFGAWEKKDVLRRCRGERDQQELWDG
jgi:hypothetical protein